ncbi:MULTISPECIES: S8 family serine peptidase [Streptomyces]|uniref:Peptidase n=1 Tax=Streptomyces canarius TaxID=285453 RepID=A0ABQ3CNY5_9ACTN|nr:S8 family peptidase [Streptomyces canarius]GHA34189.1 peptidase [Streptomyces canarius]
MTRHRTAALLLGVGTLTGALVAPAGATPTDAAARPGTPAAGPVEQVTLVTGDTVRYRRTGDTVRVVSATAGTERRQTAFANYTEGGHTYVVPRDAWGAMARGQVDKALFDITELARQHLDDRHTHDIKVIVTGRPGTAPKTVTPSTARVTHTLPRLGVRALSTGKSHATALWRSLTGERAGAADTGRAAPAHGTKIWLDGVVRPTLDVSVPLVGAPTAWEHGHTGEGVKVAVLDTGISSTHPDLKGKVDAAENFSTAADTDDHVGHGTHVASTITGSGAASGGRYRGVAPGVRLLNGKVLDDEGRGTDSGVLAGMEWAVQQGADVINMSLGGDAPSDGTDLLSTSLNRLSAASGALFVVAAGNAGQPHSVTAPGAADAALTVASTTKQDTLSRFSSRGPRVGDFGLKPEISAPGENIVAARAPGAFPDAPGDADYVSLSGTSMATPHVAGAAAILAGEHPDWSGRQIKAALTGSATVLKDVDVFGNGAGRLDVARADAQSVRAVTPSLGLGRIPWPHDPARPTTGRVTYANDGDAPVTLALSMSVTDERGRPAPDGLFSADPSVTVPAHGTATTTVRLAAGPDSAGSYEGRLTATAGDARVVTPVTAQVRELLRTVTVRVRNHAGEALGLDDAWVALQNETTGAVYPADSGDENGLRAEVPDGDYRVVGLGTISGLLHVTITYYLQGGLHVDGDRTLALDGTKAQPVTADLDDPAARPDPYSAHVTLSSTVTTGDGTDGIALDSNYTPRYVLSDKAVPGTALSYGGAWVPPQNRVTTVGEHPFEVSYVEDPQSAGYEGDITADLVDIGEETDPDQVGDVRGKVVLVAPEHYAPDPVGTPSQEQFATLVTGLKAKGAALVLTYDYIARLTEVPILQLLRYEDVEGLRERLAAGARQVHVVGTPATRTQYNLFGSVGLDLPEGHAWHFRRAALARTKAVYRNPAGGRHVIVQGLFYHDPVSGLWGRTEQRLAVPQTRVEYFTPGVSWAVDAGAGLNADWTYGASERTAWTTYRTDRRTSAAWSTAPFAPRLPNPLTSDADGLPVPAAYRSGDRLVTAIPVFNDADPNHTTAAGTDVDGQVLEKGTTELFRDGTKVDGNGTPGAGTFDLPSAAGTYRLVVRATRPSALSPKVRSEWTFTTGRTEDSVRTPVDLLDLGFALPLDGHNTAPAGKEFTGSVTVRHQPGASGTSPVRKVTVDVSYDDGRTWSPAAVTSAGRGHWSLVIPAGGQPGGHVSLRASAVDRAGDRVRQTVTRAYGLR